MILSVAGLPRRNSIPGCWRYRSPTTVLDEYRHGHAELRDKDLIFIKVLYGFLKPA